MEKKKRKNLIGNLFKCLVQRYSATVVNDRSGLHSEGYIKFR